MRIKLWFSGNPIPKGRPRWARGWFYTPPATKEWEETVGWQARSQWLRKPLEGDLGIEFIFFRQDKRRVDVDNLEKAMLDGLQGVLFEDDSQIKVKKGAIRYNQDRPGVEVTIWTV